MPPKPTVKARILRDIRIRYAAAEAEPLRHALKYIATNLSYPAPVRAQAALDLTRMNGDTRPCRIKNRCVISASAASVYRDFRLCRQQFRLKALEGELPGVQKGSW